MADRQDQGLVTSTSPAAEGMVGCPVDQDHLLLDDDTIVAVHGWHHPPGFVVGEVTYLPDDAGRQRLLGRNYRKAYVRDGLGLPEERRYRIRDATGSFFDDAQMFRAKSIIGVHRIKRYLPCAEGIGQKTGQVAALEAVASTWRSARALLGGTVDNVGVAVTGSLNLVPEAEYGQRPNDVDLVFTGSTADISELVGAMSAATRTNSETRVYEYGKGWQIRIRADGWLLCSFFRYADRREVALRGLRNVRTRCDDVHVRGGWWMTLTTLTCRPC